MVTYALWSDNTYALWCDQCDSRTTRFKIGEGGAIECICGNTLIWGNVIQSERQNRIDMAKAIWGL